MIGPALQGAQLISNIGRVAPWVLSGASMIPGIPGAVNAAGRFLNQPAAPYNPGGGGMGGRRGTSGGTTFTKPTGSLRDYGAGYKEAELRAGAAAENFRPGAGFPGQQTPAVPFSVTSGAGSFAPIDPYAAQNREYERERARVEAMVKANPDMQKQAIADERAKVRDQGMALWAKANPTLAKQVKPGAVGYDAIQQGLIGKDAGQAARQGFGYQTPQQITLTPPPGVNAPQGLPAVQSITPTETYGAQGLQADPEMVKKFQALLNLTNK